MKSKKIFIIAVLASLVLIVMLVIMYSVDMNRMKNNKPVILSTWGYEYAPAIDLPEEEINQAVIDYIIEKGDNEYKHYENEKTFASMRVYLVEEKEKNKNYNVYAWILEEKYYLENNEIKQDSGSSIPYKFVVKNIEDKFVVTDSIIPRDGGYYVTDMKKIFPSSVRNDMNNIHIDGTMEKLESDIEQQTKLYFYK